MVLNQAYLRTCRNPMVLKMTRKSIETLLVWVSLQKLHQRQLQSHQHLPRLTMRNSLTRLCASGTVIKHQTATTVLQATSSRPSHSYPD